MKLKERKIKPTIARIRDILMDSEIDIDTSIDQRLFDGLKTEFSEEEVYYALRHLKGKNLLDTRRDAEYVLTSKGYDEWLFPFGPIDTNSIFVSYATEDKRLAGKLKTFLEKLGLNVFLAHQDIEPTAKWRDRIISDLKSSYIFIALRTKNYLQKQYTEQECGFALALDKKILSLCIGTKTSEMGFCSEYQGAAFKAGDDDALFEYCRKQLIGAMDKMDKSK